MFKILHKQDFSRTKFTQKKGVNFVNIYTKATIGQLITALLIIERFTKKMQNLDQKVKQRQNTVCLEQHLNDSPENFAQTLLVMLETLRRSGTLQEMLCLAW